MADGCEGKHVALDAARVANWWKEMICSGGCVGIDEPGGQSKEHQRFY